MTKNQDDPEQSQAEPLADGKKKPVSGDGSGGSPTPAWSFNTFEESSSIEIVIAPTSDETPQSASNATTGTDQPLISITYRTHQESDTWDSKNPPLFGDEEDAEQVAESVEILEKGSVEIISQPIISELLSEPLPDNNLDIPELDNPDTQPDIMPEPSSETVEDQASESAVEPVSETVAEPAVGLISDAAVGSVSIPTEEPVSEAVAESVQSPEQPVTEKEVVIEFEHVTKSFYNQMVLRDLSFKIYKGETVCLIGESGCGKTVNLKLMIGLIRPDKGDVRFHGQSLSKMNEKQITATRIKFGFLFQMAALFDSMSIYDNVAFGLREHRMMPESEMPDYIQERLSEVGLPHGVEFKKPAELSGGQRKRVGLARALALRPEVMLYDEPTTGLDPIMTDIINELIIQTQNHGERSGIIVTHEMRTVIKCADRVIMLYPISRLGPNENQILYDGPPDGMDHSPDPRVRQFVLGEAGDRLKEMSLERMAEESDSALIPMDPGDIVAARPVKQNS